MSACPPDRPSVNLCVRPLCPSVYQSVPSVCSSFRLSVCPSVTCFVPENSRIEIEDSSGKKMYIYIYIYIYRVGRFDPNTRNCIVLLTPFFQCHKSVSHDRGDHGVRGGSELRARSRRDTRLGGGSKKATPSNPMIAAITGFEGVGNFELGAIAMPGLEGVRKKQPPLTP